MADESPIPDAELAQRITSERLTGIALFACWFGAIGLLAAGVTATFVKGSGVAPASMVTFGAVLFLLGLIGRVPLRLEVGGTKFDASYAYRAGALTANAAAITAAERADEVGAPVSDLIQQLAHQSDQRYNNFSDWIGNIMYVTDRTVERPTTSTPRVDEREGAGVTLGDYYRAPTACAAAGITYRQLDYWNRTGLIPPSIATPSDTGLYTERDIVLLRSAKRLLDAGVSLQQIRPVLATLRPKSLTDLSHTTVVSDGHNVYEATSDKEVSDLMRKGTGVFGIALAAVAREVRGSLSELPAVGQQTDDGLM